MGPEARLAELLADARALVHAFDPLGTLSVPVPLELGVGDDRTIVAASPLDPLDPTTHAAAVSAFEHARRAGHGAAAVRLAGGPDPYWLEVFDGSDRFGCYLAVLVPHDGSASVGVPTTLPPRSAIYELNTTGMIEWIDTDFTEMLGWAEDDVIGTSSLSIIHPDDHEAGIVAWVDMIQAPGSVTRLRQRFRRKDGNWLWCECTDHNRLDDPERPHVLGEIIDISREVIAEQELQRRETMLDRLYRALPSGVVVLDPDGALAVRNERWAELVGSDEQPPIEALARRVLDPGAVLAAVDHAIAEGADVDLAVRFPDRSLCRDAMLHVRPLIDAGHSVGLLMTLDDQTEHRLHERELAEQMRRDPLTGVLNRRGVEEELTERLAKRPVGALSVLYLDIDDFKSTNDLHGHAAGDQLLCAVVARVTGDLREEDTVGRMGGDEFIVLVDGPPHDAERIAERVQGSVERLADELPVSDGFGLSIGIAHRHPGDDFDSLVGRADAEMYAAKSQRRSAAGRERRRTEIQPPVG